MKNHIILLLLLILTLSCNTTPQQNNNKDNKTDLSVEKDIATIDTTPKVTGIGGIFFRSKNPKETREWYSKKFRIGNR